MARQPDDGFSAWDSPAKRLWKKSKPTRLTTSLVGLSSAAILSVYAVGYVNTQDTEEPLTVSSTQSSQTAPAPAGSGSGTYSRAQGNSGQTAPAPATRTPTPSTGAGNSSNSTAVSYVDGTYTGVGTSRHGSIQATVVVSGGKIVSADVTGCGTRYPCSKVASLPARVIANQGPPTTYVSGATDSSVAYTSAIRSALAQARSA